MFISAGASSPQSKVFPQGRGSQQPERSTPAFPQEVLPMAGVDDTDWFAAAPSQPELPIPESLELSEDEETKLWETVLDVLKSPQRFPSPEPVGPSIASIEAGNAGRVVQPQPSLSGGSNPFAFQSDVYFEYVRRTPSVNKRPSRHARYQDVLTSPETDDEIESSNKTIKKRAVDRASKRRNYERRAKELGLEGGGPAFSRYLKAQRAKELGVGSTATDYDRHLKKIRAKKAKNKK